MDRFRFGTICSMECSRLPEQNWCGNVARMNKTGIILPKRKLLVQMAAAMLMSMRENARSYSYARKVDRRGSTYNCADLFLNSNVRIKHQAGRVSDSQTEIHTSTRNPKKLWSVLTLVHFLNNGCQASGTSLKGTCYTKKQCSHKDSCGDVTRENCTYFRSPRYPNSFVLPANLSAMCDLKVLPLNNDICQLKLDFINFELFGVQEGECQVDIFSVIPTTNSIPALCGNNNGQQIYVHVPSGQKAIRLRAIFQYLIDNPELGRKFEIKITQISCNSDLLAPPGCLQYHRGESGTITSFNYAGSSPLSEGYPINQSYSICIRKERGFCSIRSNKDKDFVCNHTFQRITCFYIDRYSTDDPFQFGISEADDGALNGPDCMINAADGGSRDDYLVIPGGSGGNSDGESSDRYCGGAFTPVTTSLMPFIINVVSGDKFDGEVGFRQWISFVLFVGFRVCCGLDVQSKDWNSVFNPFSPKIVNNKPITNKPYKEDKGAHQLLQVHPPYGSVYEKYPGLQKLFPSVFTLVKFTNDDCPAFNNLTGTCMTQAECNIRGVIRTCGEISYQNNTYFVNPNFPGVFNLNQSSHTVQCDLRVFKYKYDVCQLRLDLDYFELAGSPDCQLDRFTVPTPGAPVLCGSNSGQHLYVDFPYGVDTLTLPMTLSSTAAERQFAIPPSGCLQYYTDRAGTIESFNYGDPVNNPAQGNSGYPPNANYGICIRKDKDFCSVRYTRGGPFMLGTVITDGSDGVQTGGGCQNLPLALPGRGDYVIIPNSGASTFSGIITNDRYCGDNFPILETRTPPFTVFFVSDNNNNGEGGFRLNYEQQPFHSNQPSGSK
uniref:CUB domain-containing protein n=1 Tax=Strigamia maritima TaxID=126957 RepID=T1JEW3_STRMM